MYFSKNLQHNNNFTGFVQTVCQRPVIPIVRRGGAWRVMSAWAPASLSCVSTHKGRVYVLVCPMYAKKPCNGADPHLRSLIGCTRVLTVSKQKSPANLKHKGQGLINIVTYLLTYLLNGAQSFLRT
jgi:hypothetical protein